MLVLPAALVRDLVCRRIYGTTSNGGASEAGTIFRLSLDGTFTSVASFSGRDGSFPASGVIEKTNGAIFGTTEAGGHGLYGTVFELLPERAIRTAFSFTGAAIADPFGGVIQASDGTSTASRSAAAAMASVQRLVTIRSAAGRDIRNAVTIEAWIKPRSLRGRNGIGLKGDSQLPLNEWTHVAMSYDGTTMRLFVNAVQVAERRAAGRFRPSDEPFRIGGNDRHGEFFNG